MIYECSLHAHMAPAGHLSSSWSDGCNFEHYFDCSKH